MPTPRFIQHHHADAQGERESAAQALRATPARIAPKWFYDRLGSKLFEAITELPEYYPTRTEAAIFGTHGSAIARAIGPVGTLLDLGAGNCAKAARLFPLLEPQRYVAIDVSVDFLRESLRRIAQEHPRIEAVGLGIDLSEALDVPPDLVAGRPLFFYPGSSIGNYTPDEALAFLQRVHARAGGGGLLIGVDLAKPAARLEPAYDDALGVTAAFNLNALRHLNAALGTDFLPADWRHVAFYDAAAARIEMHLEARRHLLVSWPGGQRSFRGGERILTEYSYKYRRDHFAALLQGAGFAAPVCWTDPAEDFAVFWAPA
jgi:L-histidine Nalpha-methyltransferase